MQDEISKKEARRVKLLKVCDGLHYSLEMLKLSYAPLWRRCNEILRNASKAIEAIQDAWTFIDSIHRLRQLSQVIPTVSAKHPEIRAFLSATEEAEEFRNYIQHLRNELHARDHFASPVWGALSWVDENNPNMSHTAVLGTDIAGISYPSCGWDLREGKFASRVSLGLKNLSFNFDSIFEAAMRFQKFVNEHVKPGAEAMPSQPTGLPILSYEISAVAGGVEIRTLTGIVMPAGTREVRAPNFQIQASVEGHVRAVSSRDD